MQSLIGARGTARLFALVIGGCLAIFVVTSASAEIEQMPSDEASALIAELDALVEGDGGTPDGMTPAVEDICTHWG